MRYLRDYDDGLTDDQRKFLNKNTRGTWSVNNEGLVDIKGGFYCYGERIEDFLGIRFGKVSGHFYCWGNQLRTLEGSPKVVVGNFNCRGNQLRTLDGAPSEVGGDFICFSNQLRTLEGSPREVRGGFYCHQNPLISLEGAPEVIKVEFRFKNSSFRYNLQSFLNRIDQIKPDELSLLLTHHFFTPEVIREQITKNPDFPYYVSLVWNTEPFKKTQDELKKILPENILLKIDDLWSIGGYL